MLAETPITRHSSTPPDFELIDADLKVVALTEKLYGNLRRNFFDGFLYFLGGTR
jgi:hypothetical protein